MGRGRSAVPPREVVNGVDVSLRRGHRHIADGSRVGRVCLHPELGVDVENSGNTARGEDEGFHRRYVGGSPRTAEWAVEWMVDVIVVGRSLEIVVRAFQAADTVVEMRP